MQSFFSSFFFFSNVLHVGNGHKIAEC